MPLERYYTLVDFSSQVKQYVNTRATLSGETNVLQAFYIKDIEIDTFGSTVDDVLSFTGTKYIPAKGGSVGNAIINGLLVSYNSGLTYNVSSGLYRINGNIYGYTGGTVDITSGHSAFSRFDVFYITTAQTPYVRTGIPAPNPLIPAISGGELAIGIVLVPLNFTGGTGSTIYNLGTTGATPFVYNSSSAGGIEREVLYNSTASGDYSFAAGRNSRAYLSDSVALGLGVYASGFSQTVVGQYNSPYKEAFFIVGNGIDDSNRENAFIVDNSGNTRAENKLFVTNIEIETTGGSENQILRLVGGKYKPSSETFTGISYNTGGTPLLNISGNNIFSKNLSAGTNITFFDDGEIITINANFSAETISAITTINTVGNGQSLLSSQTQTIANFYSISGGGGTSVILQPNGLILISSTTTGTTSGAINVGVGSSVFKTKTGTVLEFKRISGVGETIVYENTDNIFVSSSTKVNSSNIGGGIGILTALTESKNVIGKSLSGNGLVSISENNGLIVINVPTGLTATTTSISGVNLNLGSQVFKQKTGENLEFRTFSGGGDIRVVTSGDIILITSSTITGNTNVGGGISFLSSATSNKNIIGKSISGGGLVTVSEVNGLIIVSAITSTTLTGLNVGTGLQIFKSKTGANLEFRTITGTGRNTSTIVSDVIVINGAIEVNSGTTRNLAIYRSTNPEVFDSASNVNVNLAAHTVTSRTYTIQNVGNNANFIMSEGNQIINGKKEFVSGYTIGPSGNSGSNNFSNLYNVTLPSTYERVFSVHNGNNNDNTGLNIITAQTQVKFSINKSVQTSSTDSISGITALLYHDNYLISNSDIFLSSNTINVIVNNRSGASPLSFSIGNAFFFSSDNIKPFAGSPTVNNVNTLFESQFETSNSGYYPQRFNSERGLQIGKFFKTNSSNQGLITHATDLYISKPIGYSANFRFTNTSAIYIEGKENSTHNDILNRQGTIPFTPTNYTNDPWSIFAEADKAYFGGGIILSSGASLTTSIRGWLDIGPSQASKPHIRFQSGVTVTSPQTGDFWWDGTGLYFRTVGSTANLLASVSGGSTGLTTAVNIGSGLPVFKSASTSTLTFNTISSATPSLLSIIQTSGGLLVFSAATQSGGGGGSGITGATTVGSGIPVISGIVSNNLFIRSITSGPNVTVYQNGDDIVISAITSTGTTNVNGVTGLTFVGGGIQPLSAISVSNNLISKTLSAGTNITIIDSNGLITLNGVPSSGSGVTSAITMNTGASIFISADTSNFKLRSIIGSGLTNVIETNNQIIINTNLFNTITYTDALDNTIPFVSGQWYRITNRPDAGVNTQGDILLMALTDTIFSNNGYLLAINADYESYIVPYIGYPINNGDIVIYNNKYYQNNSISLFVTNESDITTLTELPKDYVNYPYSYEIDEIDYDLINDVILMRKDKRHNIVNQTQTNNYINTFRFGDNNVRNNKIDIIGDKDFNISNIKSINFKNNHLININSYKFDSLEEYALIVNNNYINDKTFDLVNYYKDFSGATFINKKTGLSTVADITSLTNIDMDQYLEFDEIIFTSSNTAETINRLISTATTRPNVTIKTTMNTLTIPTNNLYQRTEGGLDVVLSTIYDSVEFQYINGVFYQININNY